MTELVRRLDPARWEVHLACFDGRGPWFERAAEHAASVAEFPVKKLRASGGVIRHVSQFASWCRRRRIARCPGHRDLLEHLSRCQAPQSPGVPVRIGSRRGPQYRIALEVRSRCSALRYACANEGRGEFARVGAPVSTSNVCRGERSRSFRTASTSVPCAPLRASQAPLRKVTVVANLRKLKGHDVLVDASVAILRTLP